MLNKVLIALVAIVIALAGGALALVHVYGPSYGIMVTGTPIFLVPPSPEKYATTVLEATDLLALNADSPEYADARARAVEASKSARDYSELYDPLKDALKAAGGKHSNLVSPQTRADVAEKSPLVDPTVTVDGGVVIATVPEFDGFTGDGQSYADSVAKGLDGALSAGACGAIVDLRGNGGGDMGPMLAGVSPLVPDGTALEFVGRSDTSPVIVSGGSASGGGTPTSVEGVGKYEVPVAVLIDEGTASSGEATALAFKGLGDARFFGRASAGYASANIAFEMPDGALVMITTAEDRDRTGMVYGDSPVTPDEESDDAMGAARAWLGSEYSCR